MNRRRALALAAGLALLLALALATLPARLVVQWLDRERVALSAVQGTLWRGSAARAMVMTVAGPMHLGELRWRLQPLSLLSLAPRVTVDSHWGSQRLVARLSRRGDRWELRDVDAMLDARLLRQLLPVELRGRISVQLASATATAERLLQAEGRVVWQDAAWQTGRGRQRLGNFVALLSGDGEGAVAARIDTLSGPLRVQGTLRLDGRRYSAQARIEAPGGMDAQLARALSLIAEPRENGYLLRLGGELGRLR